MTIRILCIVVALITAVWISYKIGLSILWTVQRMDSILHAVS